MGLVTSFSFIEPQSTLSDDQPYRLSFVMVTLILSLTSFEPMTLQWEEMWLIN